MKFKSQNFYPFHALTLCNKGSLKLVGMKEHMELELDSAVGKIKAIFFSIHSLHSDHCYSLVNYLAAKILSIENT